VIRASADSAARRFATARQGSRRISAAVFDFGLLKLQIGFSMSPNAQTPARAGRAGTSDRDQTRFSIHIEAAPVLRERARSPWHRSATA